MPINRDEYKTPKMLTLLSAWEAASEIVEQIVDKHELTAISNGSMFNVVTVHTKVAQHINHIMDVADWLLNEGD